MGSRTGIKTWFCPRGYPDRPFHRGRRSTVVFGVSVFGVLLLATLAPAHAQSVENRARLHRPSRFGSTEGSVVIGTTVWFDDYLYRKSPDASVQRVTEENGEIIRADLGRTIGRPSVVSDLSGNLTQRGIGMESMVFNLSGRLSQVYLNETTSSGASGTHYRLKEAALTYTERFRKRYSLSGGRVSLSEYGLPAVDGAQFLWISNPRLTLGVFGGLRPEPLEQKVSVRYPFGGALFNLSRGRNRRTFDFTTSVSTSIYKGKPYRPALFFSLHSNLSDSIAIMQYTLLDFYTSKWTLRPTTSSTLLFFQPSSVYWSTLSFIVFMPDPQHPDQEFHNPPSSENQRNELGVLPDSTRFYKIELDQAIALSGGVTPYLKLSYRYRKLDLNSPVYPALSGKNHQLYGQLGVRKRAFFHRALDAEVGAGLLEAGRARTVDGLLVFSAEYIRSARLTVRPRVYFHDRRELYSDRQQVIHERETTFRVDLENRFTLTKKLYFDLDYTLFADRDSIDDRYALVHSGSVRLGATF